MRPYFNPTDVAQHVTLVEATPGKPAEVDADGKETAAAVAPVDAEEVIVGGGERVDLDEKSAGVQNALSRGVLVDVIASGGGPIPEPPKSPAKRGPSEGDAQ